jgi:hypothetical protein
MTTNWEFIQQPDNLYALMCVCEAGPLSEIDIEDIPDMDKRIGELARRGFIDPFTGEPTELALWIMALAIPTRMPDGTLRRVA